MKYLWLLFILFTIQSNGKAIGTAVSEKIPAGKYVPFFSSEKKPINVKSFKLDVYPVTQKEYLDFLKYNSDWSRSNVKPIFADKDYLKNWPGDFETQKEDSPVTYVSWYAAKAYCKWKHKRLPTLDEWEYVGEADEADFNAISGSKFKQRILQWYNKPTQEVLPKVSVGFRNAYGIYGMHGLIWEWVFDFNSTLINDGRINGSKLPKNLFCAGGAAGAADATDYAAFMRYAFRSSLKGSYTVKNLGFRCAQGDI